MGHGTLFFFLLIVSPFLWEPVVGVGALAWPVLWSLLLLRPTQRVRRSVALFLVLHYCGIALAFLDLEGLALPSLELSKAMANPAVFTLVVLFYLAFHVALRFVLGPILPGGRARAA
jgi:hypothetical protein